MSNETLKLELMQWLSELEDEQAISALKSVKDSYEAEPVELTEEQKESLERSIEDIENGRFYTNEEVMTLISVNDIELTIQQKKDLDKSLQQIKDGEVHSQQEVEKMFNEWLKK